MKVLPVRSPLFKMLLLSRETWVMLKVEPLAWRCPPGPTVISDIPEVLLEVKVVPVALSVPLTAICWVE